MVKQQLAIRASGQVLCCNGVSSIGDTVCGTLQEALLLREPRLVIRRRKTLSSPSDVTYEVVCSFLLPVFYLQPFTRAGEMKRAYEPQLFQNKGGKLNFNLPSSVVNAQLFDSVLEDLG